MSEIRFVPRWREELEAIGHGRKLVFELIRELARFHLYFPTESRWQKVAPEWARERWAEYHAACTAWCEAEKARLSVVDDAHVSDEAE